MEKVMVKWYQQATAGSVVSKSLDKVALDVARKITRTVKEQGGATFDLDGILVDLKTGYMISLPGLETKIPEAVSFNQLVYYVKEQLKKTRDQNLYYNRKNVVYFGVWFYDGFIYLDSSENFQGSLIEAVELGKERNQESIYNCAWINEEEKYISCK